MIFAFKKSADAKEAQLISALGREIKYKIPRARVFMLDMDEEVRFNSIEVSAAAPESVKKSVSEAAVKARFESITNAERL